MLRAVKEMYKDAALEKSRKKLETPTQWQSNQSCISMLVP